MSSRAFLCVLCASKHSDRGPLVTEKVLVGRACLNAGNWIDVENGLTLREAGGCFLEGARKVFDLFP